MNTVSRLMWYANDVVASFHIPSMFKAKYQIRQDPNRMWYIFTIAPDVEIYYNNEKRYFEIPVYIKPHKNHATRKITRAVHTYLSHMCKLWVSAT